MSIIERGVVEQPDAADDRKVAARWHRSVRSWSACSPDLSESEAW